MFRAIALLLILISVLPAEQGDSVDAVLLIDSSGSMRITDPEGLRYEGAQLFTQLLSKGDRLSIVAFDDSPRILRPLSDFDPAEDLKSLIRTAGDSGTYTNLLSAVKEAEKILSVSPRKNASQVIVLLSDGKMEVSSGDPNDLTNSLLGATANALRQSGVKVYTLAFSDLADKEILSQLAAFTNAVHWYTPDATKIHESYADLFLAVKKPQVVAFSKRGFKIDKDIQEATFYIDRSTATGIVELISPAGQKISEAEVPSGVKWFTGQKFYVVTVLSPTPGDWGLSGVDGNEGFATLLTNLKLVTDWPPSMIAGEKVLLQARLFEEDKPVVLPEMTASGQYAFQISPTDKISEPILRDILSDDGQNGDKAANDGVFSKEVSIDEPGEYRIRILAKAPTFERNQNIPFRVRPRLVSVTPSEETDEILVKLSHELDGALKLDLELLAIDAENKKLKIPLTKIKEGEYKAAASLLPSPGIFTILASVEGITKRKTEFKGTSVSIQYERTTNQEVTEVIVEELKPKEPENPSAVIPIILMLLMQGGGFAGAFLFLKKAIAGGAVSFPELPPISEMEVGLEKLKMIADSDEIDLNDSRFGGQKQVKVEEVPEEQVKPEEPLQDENHQEEVTQEVVTQEEVTKAETPTPQEEEPSKEEGS